MKSGVLTGEQRQLAGALIGLAKALTASNSDDAAVRALVDGLCALDREEAIPAQIEALQEAKRRAAPDCAACTHPCGRTADYPVQTWEKIDPECARVKVELLRFAAAFARTVSEDGLQTALLPLQCALLAVGDDGYGAAELRGQLTRLKEGAHV